MVVRDPERSLQMVHRTVTPGGHEREPDHVRLGLLTGIRIAEPLMFRRRIHQEDNSSDAALLRSVATMAGLGSAIERIELPGEGQRLVHGHAPGHGVLVSATCVVGVTLHCRNEVKDQDRRS